MAGSDGRGSRVAVVGTGCAGVLVTVHLLRQARCPSLLLCEPAAALGAGVAYGTDNPRHLMNSPASDMSALTGEPDHFVAWARRHHGPVPSDAFLPRRWYRSYLADTLQEAVAQADTDVTWCHDEVATLRRGSSATEDRFTLGLRSGTEAAADHVVLAVGAPAPDVLRRQFWGDSSVQPFLLPDPWAPGALETIPRDTDVLLIGTGLTMVDVAVSLVGAGHRGSLHARSRHGLLPLTHAPGRGDPWPAFDPTCAVTARSIVRQLREESEKACMAGGDWRSVVGAARRSATGMWRSLPERERRRLLRHAGRYWDVHRHRMPPALGEAVGDLRRTGRLTVGRGVLSDVRPAAGADRRGALEALVVTKGRRSEPLCVGAIVDCTGAGSPPPGTLLAELLASGLAQGDPLGLGLRVDEHGDLVSLSGRADHALHSIGWVRRGSEFEATSVPELRNQADELARRLAD